MKKTFIVLGVVGLLAIAFATAGTAFAQGGPPSATPAAGDGTQPYSPWGYARQAGASGTAPGRYAMVTGEEGPMHDALISAVADAIGLDPAEVEARLDAGETLSEIALAQGISLDEFQAIWLEARTSALQQAVADGTLSQEQADWLLDRMENMRGGNGLGNGSGNGPGSGDCVYGTAPRDGTGMQRGMGRGRAAVQAP